MKKSQNAIANVKFKDSIKLRINLMVGAGVVIATAMSLFTSLPSMSKNIKETTQNSMLTTAEIYGNILDKEIADNADTMNNETYLSDTLKNIKIVGDDTSYAYLVDKNGTMLYHPTASKIGQPVENDVVKGLVLQIEVGVIPEPAVIDYTYKGTRKLASYYVNAEGNYILVITADRSNIYQPIKDVGAKCIAEGIILYLILLVVFWFMIQRLIDPILIVAGKVDKLSTLDFTKEDGDSKTDIRRDEPGIIAMAVNTLKAKISETIIVIKGQGNELDDASASLEKKFHDISENVSGINTAVEEIAQGSTSQAGETATVNEKILSIGGVIDTNLKDTESLQTSVGHMTQLADTAQNTLLELCDTNKTTLENISLVTEKTEETNSDAQHIREVVKIIQDITSQTNLLSLNASIEAARAGEAGRGFAVVAEEIRKLAEDSDKSAKEIETIVKTLIQNAGENVEKMKEVNTAADMEKDRLSATKESFEGLSTEIKLVSDMSTEISGKTKELDTLKNDISTSIEQLAAISQENAASTEETSASMQTLASIVKECTDEAESLAKLSSSLKEQTDKFKL